MDITFKGTAIVVRGDHVNLDWTMNWYTGMDTIPPQEIVKSFLINVDPAIPKTVKRGDIIVGGNDFGCGKGHFSFWIAKGEIGISCIVAESFSTQMFTGALTNKDTYLVEVPGILDMVDSGDELEVEFETATVKNLTKGTTIIGNVLPPFVIELMEGGGQLEYIKRKVQARNF